MKRRRVERVERRRNVPELNLISDTKPPRLAIRRRGCLGTSVLPMVVALATFLVFALGPR